MAGAAALEGPEPGVLQALVGRGWHWLACSLTQLLLTTPMCGSKALQQDSCTGRCRAMQASASAQTRLHALANCCSAQVLLCCGTTCDAQPSHVSHVWMGRHMTHCVWHAAYPCSIVMPLLPATMSVQELDVRWRQCVWHHDPGVQNLTGGEAHQCCVTMLPSGESQHFPDNRRCIWLVATSYEECSTS